MKEKQKTVSNEKYATMQTDCVRQRSSAETTLARTIRIADDKAKYDALCKKILSEKIILAWIMKNCMEEYREYDVSEIAREYIEGEPQVSDETNTAAVIRGMGVEDISVTDGTIIFDIRFFAIVPKLEEVVRLILNVEAQNDFYPGYPIITRGIYYCSRMISSQQGVEFENSHYEKIKKVYSIWICTNPPKKRRHTMTEYGITEKNLIGEVKELKKHYDLMNAVILCLGNSKDREENDVLRLLDILLSDEIAAEEKVRILEEDFNIPMTQKIEGEVEEMCNLSKGVEEKGIRKGIERGRTQGFKNGKLFSIESLMDTMNWTIEQAMSALKIPEEEREEYIQLLNSNVLE